ncbi:MAG: endonuclease III [Chloroflexota bacterium]|nr:endonuclease III [Chloroflexota bacterium]
MTDLPPPTEPFQIDVALERVAVAVAPYPKAAMFALAELGYRTPFQQLIACMISIRTRDEESLPLSLRLFEAAQDAAAVATLTPEQIDALIAPSTFHERKAQQIHAIATQVAEMPGGELSCDGDLMRSFSGVGPKCANLALGIACSAPGISVDIHVHRIVNRWGYVSAGSPEQTMRALQATLPERYWIAINALLVPFGKHVCTGTAPRCSTCPLLDMCPRLGVTRHR